MYIYHIENSGTCHSYVLCIYHIEIPEARGLWNISKCLEFKEDTKPWHFQGALSIIIWKYKGWDVSKLGIPWVWDNYQEYPPPKITWNFRGPPQNNRFPRKTEIVYVYQGDEGFWILNRGCMDIKLLTRSYYRKESAAWKTKWSPNMVLKNSGYTLILYL